MFRVKGIYLEWKFSKMNVGVPFEQKHTSPYFTFHTTEFASSEFS